MIPCKLFSVNDLIEYGLPPFLVMSTRYFERFSVELGFTGFYKEKAKPIARDYSTMALRSLTLNLPQEPRNDVYDEPSLLTAWESVFDRLAAIGYAEDVCQWIMKLKREHSEFELRFAFNEWIEQLVEWAMGTKTFPPLNLPPEKIQDLKILILQDRLKEVDLYFKFLRIERSNEFDDEWETYIYKERGKGDWMKIHANIHLRLTTWASIFQLLSDQEIVALNQWGYDLVKKKYSLNEQYSLQKNFSLIEFAMAFKVE